MNDTNKTIAASPAGFADYIRLARLDHVTKHVFVIPGIVLALVLRGAVNDNLAMQVMLGAVVALTIASANYVINEWLDRDFDRHHPTKSARVSVQVPLNPSMVYALYFALLAVGLIAAYSASWAMFGVALLFGSQGIVYNVPPLRSKDRAFIDVLSEAVNNPFRLMIGWAIIDATTLPPGSVIVAYWFGGAFLMTAKRLSEYREIVASHGLDLLTMYRKSFRGYTETSLVQACFAYALLSTALFSIFLIKYRVEYLLVLPFLVQLFCVYLGLTLRPESVAQAPEKLFKDKRLVTSAFLFVVALTIFTFVTVPRLELLTEANYIQLP